MACGYCKGSGHTRPTCQKRIREMREAASKPVEPHAECLPRHTESPWTHVGREQGPGIFSKHTWQHNVTGEFVTATVPTPPSPPSGCPTDIPEGIIALRRPMDVFAYIARMMPSATVTRSSASATAVRPENQKPEPAAAQPAPAAAPTMTAGETGWGMW